MDIKLGPVTKLDKQNDVKKADDDFMSADSDVIVVFPIYSRFEAIQKPDFIHIVSNTYIFINSNLTKTESRTKTFLKHSHSIALSKGTIFAKKNADISKIRRVLEDIFL